MKSKVIMLIGPPLSGKDTYLKIGIYDHYTIISRDDILMDLHNNNNYKEAFHQVDPKNVDKTLNDHIVNSVTQKKNVVINMTNLTKKSRNKHLSKFPSETYEKIAIVFPKLELVDYQQRNITRKEQQNKYIPTHVLESMISNWEDVDINEGFDKIIKL